MLALLVALASALSAGDPVSAMSAFDRGMANYHSIEDNVRAMTAQDEVICSIEVVEDKKGKVEADWYLELKSKPDGGQSERRRERVQLEVKQIAGKWKIVAFQPQSILAPMAIR